MTGEHQKTFDIIIPVHDQAELTKKCLGSIFANTCGRYSIILIDNASNADTTALLKDVVSSHDNVKMINNSDNLGWVKAVNQGLKASAADYVFIMNNDTVVRTDGWATKLIEAAESDGSVGLVNPAFDTKMARAKRSCVEVDFCRGYCVLIKRKVIDAIGGLDEAYGIGYYDDDDYSVRAIRAGFKCIRANDVFVEHLRDTTFSKLFTDEERRRLHRNNKELFYSKWGRRINIFFVINGKPDRDKLIRLFFKLARRQHIVYVWSSLKLAQPGHINIRIMPYARLFYPLYRLELFLNSRKKPEKRYDTVLQIGSDDFNENDIIEQVETASKR